ncbi:MAG TPA: hypothetical protein VMV84_00760, partial [Dehalococcoidales bacterium]|nr:hypothetical protein [Dehalococcoidales bacterium]
QKGSTAKSRFGAFIFMPSLNRTNFVRTTQLESQRLVCRFNPPWKYKLPVYGDGLCQKPFVRM